MMLHCSRLRSLHIMFVELSADVPERIADLRLFFFFPAPGCPFVGSRSKGEPARLLPTGVAPLVAGAGVAAVLLAPGVGPGPAPGVWPSAAASGGFSEGAAVGNVNDSVAWRAVVRMALTRSITFCCRGFDEALARLDWDGDSSRSCVCESAPCVLGRSSLFSSARFIGSDDSTIGHTNPVRGV